MINQYSTAWFRVFLDTYPTEYTQAEVRFIQRCLPQNRFAQVLDVCCGTGRHALRLAAAGYNVTGIDIDTAAIQLARQNLSENVAFLVHDMREIDTLPKQYDAVINMWQSFGYFDTPTNTAILQAIHRKLRAGGRFIIDIYNRAYCEQHTGTRQFERGDYVVTERKQIEGNRLTVALDYGDVQNADVFSWQIYELDEFVALARECGFDVITSCTQANTTIPPSAEHPRMQFVLQRAN